MSNAQIIDVDLSRFGVDFSKCDERKARKMIDIIETTRGLQRKELNKVLVTINNADRDRRQRIDDESAPATPDHSG